MGNEHISSKDVRIEKAKNMLQRDLRKKKSSRFMMRRKSKKKEEKGWVDSMAGRKMDRCLLFTEKGSMWKK